VAILGPPDQRWFLASDKAHREGLDVATIKEEEFDKMPEDELLVLWLRYIGVKAKPPRARFKRILAFLPGH